MHSLPHSLMRGWNKSDRDTNDERNSCMYIEVEFQIWRSLVPGNHGRFSSILKLVFNGELGQASAKVIIHSKYELRFTSSFAHFDPCLVSSARKCRRRCLHSTCTALYSRRSPLPVALQSTLARILARPSRHHGDDTSWNIHGG